MLLRLISWPYVRRHLARTILTTAAVVLGGAVYVGTRTANRAVALAFARTVDRIAGKTDLQVTAGEAGFGEDVLDRVQASPAVRVAVPVIEAVVDTNIGSEGKLLVLGVDMTGDQSLREYDFESTDSPVVDDPLVFLAQPDSLILSKDFGARNHIAAGAHIRLGTVDGDKDFTVRGLMTSSGLTSAFGGNLAVMDIYAAQKMFGRGRTFDRIELAVKPGVSLADCQRDLTARLGPAFTIQPPSSRSQQFETILAGYSAVANLSSAFALFVAIFIIYNSFAVAVAERRSEIGVLRALGASRRQIRSLFLSEGALLGLVGSACGVVAGVLIARAVSSFIGTLIGDVYGLAQGAGELGVESSALVLAAFVGVGTSTLAAAIPAHQASVVDPTLALQKGTYQVSASGQNRMRAIIAIGLGFASAVCAIGWTAGPMVYIGYALAILAVILLAPALSLMLAKSMRPLLKWLRPVEGVLAADSLIQSPRRMSATVIGLMLSIALIVAFSGMAHAIQDTLVDWMATTLNPDLFVLPSHSLDVQTTRFPGAMRAEIAALPGVERVQTLRNARIMLGQTPIMVIAIEMTSVGETDEREPIAGHRGDMYRRAAEGQAVLVSDNLARLRHLELGQLLEVPAPYGVIRLPIAGIVLDYSDQQGAILMDRSLFIQHWHDETANAFRVYTSRAVGADVVRQEIIRTYSGHRSVFVLRNGEMKSYVLGVINQWFGLTTVQIALGIVVALLGIVNTLTVSIVDRRREIGILRAVGGLRRQIRQTIWIEALAISAIGLVLGVALGAMNLYYVVQIVRQGLGMTLRYRLPLTTVVLLVPLMLGAAFCAAVWPGETAVRRPLMEALAYE